MKTLILLLSAMLSFTAVASAKDAEIVRCKLEGENLDKYVSRAGRYAFPQNEAWGDLVAGEFLLLEEVNDTDGAIPTKIKIKLRAYYNKDGKIARKGNPGAPLTRVGYSQLNDTITFSYSSYDWGAQADFHITTNGKKSVINYTQSALGYTKRGGQHSIDCIKVKDLAVDVKPLDMDRLSKEGKIAILEEYRYRKGVRWNNFKTDSRKKKFKDLKKKLVKLLNEYDYAKKAGVKRVEWTSPKKCGTLSHKGYYDGSSISAVLDYSGTVIGFSIGSLTCKNKLKYIKQYYNRETGEPEEEESYSRQPHIEDLLFDKDLNLLTTPEVQYY